MADRPVGPRRPRRPGSRSAASPASTAPARRRPQTLKGQPLHPWTIPNAIGYVRLALIPVFLVIAFSSGDGQDWRAALIFAIVGWSDYFDGIAARADRPVLAPGRAAGPARRPAAGDLRRVVCWHFELLPRWALALLAARELFMLCLVRWGLRHGADIKVNWLGRLGVWPVLGALFFAMAGLETVGEICLYVGLVLVLGATVKYVRDGLASRPSSSG